MSSGSLRDPHRWHFQTHHLGNIFLFGAAKLHRLGGTWTYKTSLGSEMAVKDETFSRNSSTGHFAIKTIKASTQMSLTKMENSLICKPTQPKGALQTLPVL